MSARPCAEFALAALGQKEAVLTCAEVPRDASGFFGRWGVLASEDAPHCPTVQTYSACEPDNGETELGPQQGRDGLGSDFYGGHQFPSHLSGAGPCWPRFAVA